MGLGSGSEVAKIIRSTYKKRKRMNNILQRHDLNFEKAYSYLKDQLDCGYILSDELLRILNFEEGQFFTLLPSDADLTRIYNFFEGLILPQNPTYEQISATGKKSFYTWIPNLKNELSHIILEKIKLKQNNVCVFEDVTRRLEDSHLDFYNQYGVNYLGQIYYLINNEIATKELIATAIGKSNALWHLLFILTESVPEKPLNKEISLDEIQNLCKKTQLLVVGAYDGEGYVFWEPYKTA